ncbi:conidiospore surface protein [Colletotrichum kahawae]|uniref:Conidiospore surface protein n=1 Tax=Colletotrichum kahawae TaxID=34407 RepID=A0AAE0CXC6_COLKA|nr:conidiospore surface protein [Colletotrichum kahawae]
MRLLTLLNVFSVVPVLVLAASCNNNCGRQVAGTGRRDPPLSTRSSLCSEFVTTYVTVARGPPTDVPQSRDEPSVPIVTGTKPVYASACADPTAYCSACQCFTGIKATTITIVAGAETTTSSIPSPQITSTPLVTTTATTTSDSVSPSCTIGAEFALHVIDEESDLCQNMLQFPYFGPENYDIKGLLQDRRPDGVGIQRYPDYDQQDDSVPINYSGVQGPPGSSLRCNVVVHRGYIKATLRGAYELFVSEPPREDVMFLWFGDKARSGAFNVSNADIIVPNDRGWPYRHFVYFRDASEYIPFRMFWSHGKGRGSFSVAIFPSYGTGLDEDVVPENPIFYSNCSGSNSPAPAWPAWESEDWSGGN